MKILLHPIWLTCFFLFLIHQIAQKILGWNFEWADNYLDSLLCMPIYLGVILAERRFFMKKLNSKTANAFSFSIFEVLVITLALSIIFEEGFPLWSNQFTKDYWDYFNYLIGGLFFYFYLNNKYINEPSPI